MPWNAGRACAQRSAEVLQAAQTTMLLDAQAGLNRQGSEGGADLKNAATATSRSLADIAAAGASAATAACSPCKGLRVRLSCGRERWS